MNAIRVWVPTVDSHNRTRVRPGNCFQCGKPAHWRAQCPTLQPKTNSSFWLEQHEPGSYISNDYLDIDDDVHFPCLGAGPSCAEFSFLDSYELDSAQEKSDKSVWGRLTKCISDWERINAPGFILEVIREGYKIPFVFLPPPKHGVNNLSAIKEADFVCEAILDLIKMNCIEELSEVPNIASPLSVSIQSSGKSD